MGAQRVATRRDAERSGEGGRAQRERDAERSGKTGRAQWGGGKDEGKWHPGEAPNSQGRAFHAANTGARPWRSPTAEMQSACLPRSAAMISRTFCTVSSRSALTTA